MSEAFEILSAALDEAIADAKKPTLERELVTKEDVTIEFAVKSTGDESKAG